MIIKKKFSYIEREFLNLKNYAILGFRGRML